MAENVVVQLDSASLDIAPGGSPVTLPVRVINATSIVDSFRITITGGDEWLAAPSAEVRLLPGAQTTVAIQMSIPADRFVAAGPRTLEVQVVSLADSRIQQTVQMPVQVREVSGALNLRLDPQVVSAAGDARLLVWVRNPGNAPVNLAFRAEESKGLSVFTFQPETMTVPPRHEMASAVSVSTKRPMFGSDDSRSFTVRADGARTPLAATGTLTVKPVISRRLVRFGKIMLAALAVVAVAAVAFALMGSKVDVPKVTGKTEAEATQTLEDAGFAVDVTTANDGEVPAGAVIDQTPMAGLQAKKESVIAITVSLGPVQVDVPNVVGLSQADALIALQNVGLRASPGQQMTSELPPGTVVEQSPKAGEKAAKDSAVTLFTSAGLEPVTVPDVHNRTQAEAQSELEGLGFLVQVTEEYSADVAAGVVIGQAPAANESVAAGSIISLVVSAGSEPFGMPNVVGMSREDATDLLTGMGLVVAVNYRVSVFDTGVIEQAPLEGELVATGAEVTITVGTVFKQQPITVYPINPETSL